MPHGTTSRRRVHGRGLSATHTQLAVGKLRRYHPSQTALERVFHRAVREQVIAPAAFQLPVGCGWLIDLDRELVDDPSSMARGAARTFLVHGQRAVMNVLEVQAGNSGDEQVFGRAVCVSDATPLLPALCPGRLGTSTASLSTMIAVTGPRRSCTKMLLRNRIPHRLVDQAGDTGRGQRWAADCQPRCPVPLRCGARVGRAAEQEGKSGRRFVSYSCPSFTKAVTLLGKSAVNRCFCGSSAQGRRAGRRR